MNRCLPLLFLSVFFTFCHAAPLSSYRIAVIHEATAAERCAGEELREYIRLCTGAVLPLVEYSPTLSGPLLVVGPVGDALSLMGLGSVEEFRKDEIFLRSDGDRLFLCGARPRGTLYAVYEFLERTLGVMWLAADATITPSSPSSLELPPWDYRYAPEIYIRAVSSETTGGDPAFHSHLRNNGSYQPNDIRYGGWKDLGFRMFVHTFDILLPPGKYFDRHPEWYSYRKEPFRKAARRRDSQLCLTNKEMRKELVKKTLQALRDDPGYGFISVSQNDNTRYCQCDECNDFIQKHGNITDLYIDLVNEVAEAVEKEFPDVLVETLAYRFTRNPPKTIWPRHNVAIRSCTIEAASFQTLETPGPNSRLHEDMIGWAPLARQMLVWDYVTVFRKYWQPHPNWATFAPNMRLFRDCGVISVFEQNNTNGGGRAADLPELRNWVLSKLMWNPDLDTFELIDQFLEPYYGPAAEFVRKYIHTTTELAKGADNCYTMTTTGWLPEDVLLSLWHEGEELCERFGKKPTYGPRIIAAVLPLAMCAMERGLTPPEPWKADDYADELLARLNSLGVVTLTEHADAPGHTPELWRRRLK